VAPLDVTQAGRNLITTRFTDGLALRVRRPPSEPSGVRAPSRLAAAEGAEWPEADGDWANMNELRAERHLRVLFAFDPRRTAILLIGGDKSPDEPSTDNWNRWYDQFVPVADDLYDAHLAELRTEGLI
jgi:hypothetical protein